MKTRQDSGSNVLMLPRTLACERRHGAVRHAHSSSNGVVLILVLGVLTIMTLMAVAFSISMRTERVASGNYADHVRARQLVHAGLARAMDDIREKMGASAYPECIMSSYVDEADHPDTDRVDFLRGSASNFVPRALWADAVRVNSHDRAHHYWINMYAEGQAAAPNLIGRVAYMIINCSGLLDANFAGGGVRAQGINPDEMAIEHLPDINNANNFLMDRSTRDIRYETLHDLAAVNTAVSDPENLFIYSHFPHGYWDRNLPDGGGVSTGINVIGLDPGELRDEEAAIKDALERAGFAGSDERDLLYENLVHYVSEIDGNMDMFAIDRPHVRLFPMINEIVVSSTVEATAQNDNGGFLYTFDMECSIELWNPFVTSIGSDFELRCEVTLTPQTPASGPLPPATDEHALPAGTFDPESFDVLTCSPSFSFQAEEAAEVSYQVSVRPSVWLKSPQIQFDGFIDAAVFSFEEHEVGTPAERALECLDPRFNWDPNDGAQWREAEDDTLRAINTWTQEELDPAANDGSTAMYVAEDSLNSVGELGYLVYDEYAPWRTVKLYGPDAHRVLDVFTQGPPDRPRRGLVNPNTLEIDSLAAAFADMPVDSHPGGPELARLSMADARILADDRIIFDGPYTNLSEVFSAFTDFGGLSVSWNITTELEREAFIRNAAGLLGVRQNLFTVIIEANVSRGLVVPEHPPMQRAVAVVWRDPYTGRSFVRSIKWLED